MKGPHYITPINTIYKILSNYFGKNFYYKGENLPTYLPKLSVLSVTLPLLLSSLPGTLLSMLFNIILLFIRAKHLRCLDFFPRSHLCII